MVLGAGAGAGDPLSPIAEADAPMQSHGGGAGGEADAPMQSQSHGGGAGGGELPALWAMVNGDAALPRTASASISTVSTRPFIGVVDERTTPNDAIAHSVHHAKESWVFAFHPARPDLVIVTIGDTLRVYKHATGEAVATLWHDTTQQEDEGAPGGDGIVRPVIYSAAGHCLRGNIVVRLWGWQCAAGCGLCCV